MSRAFSEDINRFKELLRNLPRNWEGKRCILELKEANYNWRQMEWWAFYFEFLVRKNLSLEFSMPGEKIENVVFDIKGKVNWDLKAKAIKSDDPRAILNDQKAMDKSIRILGEHGTIIALCDVEYNDLNRSFQKWHTALKGGLSSFEKAREKRTAISRYRKTRATLREILFLRFDKRNVKSLDLMRQGRNSNGRPRPAKYMLHFDKINEFIEHQLVY